MTSGIKICGAPDAIEATAMSSRTAKLAVLMLGILLSGQLREAVAVRATECILGSVRRKIFLRKIFPFLKNMQESSSAGNVVIAGERIIG